MAVTAQAVKPPIHAPAPPVTQAAPEASQAVEAPQRLLTSLSSIPAVQRKCAACEAEEEHKEMPVQPRLKVGPVNDPYEREADDIAGRVMAMREPQPGTSEASGAEASVQRACAACAKSDDEAQRKTDPLGDATMDEEDQARMQAGGAGGESVAASSSQLTSGGAPLSEGTRDFYESRMGRDLSDVRVHQGAASESLNESISSRAFTYKNHIWLGGDEGAAPSFTMAHELAHVLQQTQPGPVGPEVMARRAASASPAVVQRNYWQELGAKHLTKQAGGKTWRYLEDTAIGRHTAIHEELQAAMIARDSNLVTEARIPGAAGKGTPKIWHCGYADLYKSSNSNVPGLEVTGAKGAAKKAGAKYAYRNIEGGGHCSYPGWAIHSTGPDPDYTEKHGYPKVSSSGSIINCALAPTNIKLGDVKPGHNETARANGVTQLNNYITGLNKTADRINSADGKPGCWTPNPSKMVASDITIPDDWKANRGNKGWDIEALEFRDGATSKSYKPYGLSQVPPGSKKRIRGRKSAAKDPKNAGIWVYFIEPKPSDLEAALKDPATDKTRFPTLTERMGKIFGCLKSTPATSARLCRRPADAPVEPARRTTPRLVALRASPAPRTPVRKVKPGKMEKHEDKFDLAAWNAMRVGSPAGKTSKFDKDNLKQTLTEKFSDEEENRAIEFRAAVAEGQAKNEKQMGKSLAYAVPASAKSTKKTGVIAKGKALSRAKFWSGKLAGVFGKFRQKMGKAFGKTVELWEKFQTKAKTAFGKTKLKSKHGSALAVAAKGAASQVLKSIGAAVLRKTAGLVMGCLQAGFSRFVTKLTEETPLHELQEKAKKTEEDVKAIGEEVFGDLEARAEAAVGPLRDKLKEIAEYASLITKVVGVATTIAHGLRIGTCLSGLSAAGVGAIVTCLASVGDFILSLFGASPIDYIVSLLIKSCDSRRLIAKAMLSFDSVASLPTTVARAVVGKLRDVLPKGVQDVFCKPEEITGEKISADEFKCDDSYAGGVSDGSTSGTTTGGGGTSPKGAETPQQGDKKATGADDAGGGSKPKKGGDSGGATSKKATTSQHAKVVVKGDPGVGKVIIESGIDPKGEYNNTEVDDVTITVNVGGHIFRNVAVDLVVVSLSKDDTGKLHAFCYIQSDKKVTFRNDYEDGSHYEWSPDRGPENQFDGVFRSSP